MCSSSSGGGSDGGSKGVRKEKTETGNFSRYTDTWFAAADITNNNQSGPLCTTKGFRERGYKHGGKKPQTSTLEGCWETSRKQSFIHTRLRCWSSSFTNASCCSGGENAPQNSFIAVVDYALATIWMKEKAAAFGKRGLTCFQRQQSLGPSWMSTAYKPAGTHQAHF